MLAAMACAAKRHLTSTTMVAAAATRDRRNGAQIAMLEDQMPPANTILREQIRAYRERGAIMVAPEEVEEMRADIALLEHQMAATMIHCARGLTSI